MRLDLSQSREEYFRMPTDTDVLRTFIPKTEGNITVERDIVALAQKGNVVVGTVEGTLDGLMRDLREGREPAIDPTLLVLQFEHLGSRLMILPPQYRIPSGEVREHVAYDARNLVLLDGKPVLETLLGTTTQRGPLSYRQKESAQWEPERVLDAAFDNLFNNVDKEAHRTRLCYAWWGADGHRRVVSLYRAVVGAELRAFQNLAALKLVPHRIAKELSTGKHWKHHTTLSAEQCERRKTKLRRMEDRIERYNLRPALSHLDVSWNDLIEPAGRAHFNQWTGWHVRVPSLSTPKKQYFVTYTRVPVLAADDPRRYSMPWELRGMVGEHPDKSYRANRRRREPHLGQDEDFFTHTEIGGLHSLRKIIADDHDRHMMPIPLVIPLPPIIALADQLRHQTILLSYDAQTQRFSRSVPNHTEMERQLMLKTIVKGYGWNWTTDGATFKKKHLDIDRCLITLS